MLMMGKALSAEQRLTKAVVDLLSHPRYVVMASVLALGKRVVDDKVPTACTNGRDEKYGRAFIEKLNDAQLRGLVLHENDHKLWRHLTTWRHLYKENADLANQACDYVINIKIVDENPDGFVQLPPGGLLDARFRGMDSAQVFNILKAEQQGQAQAQGGGDKPDEGTGFDDHDWDGAEDMSDEDKQALERDIDAAIRQGAMSAGKMDGASNRNFDELLTPKIDWREPTREWVTSVFAGNDISTWRRPNRRFMGTKIYKPSHYGESTGGIVLAIDTSGSIGQHELSRALTEIVHICQTLSPEWVRLLYWDTRIAGDETYNSDELEKIPSSTKPKGGGGTMVECVPAYIAEHDIKPKGVIVFTDGYLGGSWGEWSQPVLWCVMGNASATATVGQTIHVD
jgi:predicted metal-dependent peptidase